MTVAVRMTPMQRAQLARAIQQARAEREQDAAARRHAQRQSREGDEIDLAERLLTHVCQDSVVDRAEHAMGVARMVLDARGAA